MSSPSILIHTHTTMKSFTDFILSVFFYIPFICQKQNTSSGTVFDNKIYFAEISAKFNAFFCSGFKILQILISNNFASFPEGAAGSARFRNTALKVLSILIHKPKFLKARLYPNPTTSIFTNLRPDIIQVDFYE